jgi:signal transduction histidine kinase
MKTVNFYWYLYGVVAFALVLTMGTLFVTIEYIEGQNDWEDFAEDISEVIRVANTECGTQNLANSCVLQRIESYGFEISTEFYSYDSEDVGEWNNEQTDLAIYSYQNGYQAQLMDQANLWIRDSEEHLSEKEEADPSDIIITATVMTLVLFLGISLFIYWPIRRLMGWLSELRGATDALAVEDYSVRLSKLNISPFSELSERFNRMSSIIQNNLEEKRLLANAMAHELRTPLSRARLALGILQRQVNDNDQRELVRDLDRYIDELENVTENSLQLVRLQNSEPSYAPIDLHKWLLQKLDLRKGRSSKTEWVDELQPVSVDTDERFLTLIIDNLLNNAEQYAAQKVKVRTASSSEGVLIEIQDDGPGIPEELQEQALQPFSRLDASRDRRSGGVGLGLALVNTACQRLNIRLDMVSSDSGLCVRVIIPN